MPVGGQREPEPEPPRVALRLLEPPQRLVPFGFRLQHGDREPTRSEEVVGPQLLGRVVHRTGASVHPTRPDEVLALPRPTRLPEGGVDEVSTGVALVAHGSLQDEKPGGESD